MKILSIDTSSNICGVAILEDPKLIKEINLDNGLTHSESLMPTIDKIFKETNLQLKDIDLIVCDKGPGSFTGIRIGVSTAMAFSDSLNIATCGISSLEALAYNINTDGIICSLIDARNSNCYCGIFELNNGNYKLLKPLSADHIDNILDNLTDYYSGITFVGNGAIVNKDLICSRFGDCIISNNNDLSGYKLGLAGLNAYSSGNYNSVMPLYLRKSQAERMLNKKNQKSV
ncbi:MAG: tRNA (adenosine(37)-N6)-threonylcarbamoyltransferase complex dimerization subunit type 1 TsaB [Clostridia bacterium]|nr:tRNA (adenosine(37)-N6)-threonylcarbamoyltransferase complex dimerization subunit type 1 TsaB [Clostridia bacterium]